MSVCAVSVRSISVMTDSVNPASPIMTSGESSCACARKAERCAEDKVKMLIITSDFDIGSCCVWFV